MLLLTDTKQNCVEFTQKEGCLLYQFPLLKKQDDVIGTPTVVLHVLKMRELYPILANQKKDDLPVSSSLAKDSFFKVLRANKHVFEQEADHFQQEQGDEDLEEEEDEVRKAFPEVSHCNVLTCTSREKGVTHFYPLVKQRVSETSKVVKNFYLITNKKNMKEMRVTGDQSTRLNSFFLNSREFGNDIDSFITVTGNHMRLYDSNLDLSRTFSGLRIRSCFQVHQSYLYTISDSIVAPYTMTDETLGEDSKKEKPSNWQYTGSGFYVYDISRLFKGKIEKYKLASTIGGVCCHIDNSKFSDRVSFISDYDNIAVIPFPHINLINLVGMGSKHEYLIWREKNGFFSALDRFSNLQTWSLITGKLMYNEPQKSIASRESMQDYSVYRADEHDVTYTRSFYN